MHSSAQHPARGPVPVGGGTPQGESGTSLVELMVAIFMAVVFVGALLSAAIQQSTHRQTNMETSLAMSAAMDNLERVRAVPFSGIPALDGSGFDVPGANGNPGGLQPLPGDPDGLPGELTVTVDDSSGGYTLYRVTASVSWRGVQRSRRIQVETLVAERK